MPTYADAKINMWRALMQEHYPGRGIPSLALAILAFMKKAEADYAEECAEYARQGYIPHYCPHGTDLWVDWDPICQSCEDGGPEGSLYERALDKAREVQGEVLERAAVYSLFIDQAAMDRSEEADRLRSDYARWVTKPRDQIIDAHNRKKRSRGWLP